MIFLDSNVVIALISRPILTVRQNYDSAVRSGA